MSITIEFNERTGAMDGVAHHARHDSCAVSARGFTAQANTGGAWVSFDVGKVRTFLTVEQAREAGRALLEAADEADPDRLLAAAPDLLEACRAMREGLAGNDLGATLDAEKLIVAAIAKAEGAA